LTNWSLIRSGFRVSVAKSKFADIVIYSSASTLDTKLYTLRYEVENHGNAFVHFVMNLPIVDPMLKTIPLTRGLVLPPSSTKIYEATIESQVSVQTASVLVSDENNKVGLAADVVGIYAPLAGKRLLDDQKLFDSVQ
jgi:hypothetical protein